MCVSKLYQCRSSLQNRTIASSIIGLTTVSAVRIRIPTISEHAAAFPEFAASAAVAVVMSAVTVAAGGPHLLLARRERDGGQGQSEEE